MKRIKFFFPDPKAVKEILDNFLDLSETKIDYDEDDDLTILEIITNHNIIISQHTTTTGKVNTWIRIEDALAIICNNQYENITLW